MAYTHNNNGRIFTTIWLLTIVTVTAKFTIATAHDSIPHLCDSVKCPPLSEITCPEDSDIREATPAFGLLHATTAALIAEGVYSATEITEETFAQCCLAKKCICRTCHIPDCHNEGEVVVEVVPESMDKPGLCCGQYVCHKEPNCTEVRDTDSYWLTNCQRCRCYSSERICHQSCDEGMKKSTAICNSKNLNRFFEHGESWKDGCYECECVNGEEKCVMPFCRSVNCPTHRQVFIKDSCCPICWPKGMPMPIGNEDYDYSESAADVSKQQPHIFEEDDDDVAEHIPPVPHATDDYAENELDILPNIRFDKESTNTTTSTTIATLAAAASTTSKAVVTTAAPTPTATAKQAEATTSGTTTSASAVATITASPCLLDASQNAPATYQLYPEVVEVVHQTPQNDVFYAVIGVLLLLVLAMGAYIAYIRAKQRSYHPVSGLDDNFNKMLSNIKKTNEYV